MVKIIKTPISKNELKEWVHPTFVSLVKAVIDVELEIMAVGGELHADEEALLLERGSKQENLWGINIYHNKPRHEWVEFDSMINIRPRQNNRSRNVEDENIKIKITSIIDKLIRE